MQTFFKKLKRFIASPVFFGFTMMVFFVSSTWIALSARFPMAFDEGYHLGIIRLYSHQLSPFFFTQPPGPAPYGQLTRDPSYLYHWLMSFPYRWTGYFSSSQMTHIIVLRCIDIALFAAGLVLFRALLLKTNASRAVVHAALFFFILVPVVPQVAGQINYDDMLMPLVALSILLTIQFVERAKAKKRMDIGLFFALMVVCFLSSVEKFTFLPILTAIAAYLLFEYWRINRTYPHKLPKAFNADWNAMDRNKKYGLLAVGALCFGLFFYTYGVNIVEYHNPIPQCGQVLGVQRCSVYAPWARNYADAKYNTGVDPNPITFMASWLYGMFNRLFFTINGPRAPESNANFMPPVLAITAAAVSAFGFVLFFRYSKTLLKRDTTLTFLLFVTFIYAISLIGRNYHDYLQLGKMVAINGRYLLPIMLPVIVALILAYQKFLATWPQAKVIFFIMSTILFLCGGGAIGFIYYSDSGWYWPTSTLAKRINHDAQTILYRSLFINTGN